MLAIFVCGDSEIDGESENRDGSGENHGVSFPFSLGYFLCGSFVFHHCLFSFFLPNRNFARENFGALGGK